MARCQCGEELPAQTRGRPRKWHSETCRKRQYAVLTGRPSINALRQEARKIRDDKIIELRVKGLLNYEIAREIKTTAIAIDSAVSRMRRDGIDVPDSPYDPHRWIWGRW